jgi:hypothetical protein
MLSDVTTRVEAGRERLRRAALHARAAAASAASARHRAACTGQGGARVRNRVSVADRADGGVDRGVALSGRAGAATRGSLDS